jgi:hypothetical protein
VRTEEVWRVRADSDPEKEWDSDNPDDALIDAENAFDDGARTVTIERIDSTPVQPLPNNRHESRK